MEQGYTNDKLKIYGKKFYGRYSDLLLPYRVSLTVLLGDLVILRLHGGCVATTGRVYSSRAPIVTFEFFESPCSLQLDILTDFVMSYRL